MSLARSFGKRPISFAVSFAITTLSAALVVESLRNNTPPSVFVKSRNVTFETGVRPKNGSCIVLVELSAEDFTNAHVDVDEFLEALGTVLHKIVIDSAPRGVDLALATTFKVFLMPLFEAVVKIEAAALRSDDGQIGDTEGVRESSVVPRHFIGSDRVKGVDELHRYHEDVRGIAFAVLVLMEKVASHQMFNVAAFLAELPVAGSPQPSAAELTSFRSRFAALGK